MKINPTQKKKSTIKLITPLLPKEQLKQSQILELILE